MKLQYAVKISNDRVAVCGIPDDDHDCDAMGCGSVDAHILARIPIEKEKPGVPEVGAICRVRLDGVLWNARVTAVYPEVYDVVVIGTGSTIVAIPKTTWRPV